jgi:cytochrome c oxidase cbb3-type subunit 4
MDIQALRIAVTVAAFILFVGIWLWAFSSRHRARFEEAGRIPLDDDTPGAGCGRRR